MEKSEFDSAVLDSTGDPVVACKELLQLASQHVKSSKWAKWAKKKRDFSADEEALARRLTAKLNFINTHKGINTISFEASWQADEAGTDDEDEQTAAALAIFTTATYDKSSCTFEVAGDGLEEYEAGYYYCAKELRDITDEPYVELKDPMLYEEEKFAVTSGVLASLLVQVFKQLDASLLTGKQKFRFFLLEQPFEVILGLATKDGVQLAKEGQTPEELLPSKTTASSKGKVSQLSDLRIVEWAKRYSDLSSDSQRARILEEVIADSASSRMALETVVGIGKLAAPSPRWKKLIDLDPSFSAEDRNSLREWLAGCFTSYRPFGEINAVAFDGGHLANGNYSVSAMEMKDFELDSGESDDDYKCPAMNCDSWDVPALKPVMKLVSNGSSQKAMILDCCLSDAECAMFALELKTAIREIDHTLLLGKAPFRVIMASFLDKIALGIVTPKGWYELQPRQTLEELYAKVM